MLGLIIGTSLFGLNTGTCLCVCWASLRWDKSSTGAFVFKVFNRFFTSDLLAD